MFVILGLPHLVLADIGDDDRLALGQPAQIMDHVRGIQPITGGYHLDIPVRGLALEPLDVLPPGAVTLRTYER